MKRIAAVCTLLFAACTQPMTDEDRARRAAETVTIAPPVAATTPKGTDMDTFAIPTNLEKTASGLQYSIERPGTGPQPKAGQIVSVHYTGWLTNGTKFDSSRDRGAPLEFPLGQGRVIRGWDEGIAAMKIGEKRTLVIPSDLGYGARGAGARIPPHSTLVFAVELVGAR